MNVDVQRRAASWATRASAIAILTALGTLACSACGGGQQSAPASSQPLPEPLPPPPPGYTPSAGSAQRPAPTTSIGAAAGPCAAAAGRKNFDVGDDQPYKTLGQVPWNNIGLGDAVRIHWRPQPYREKFAITGSGTAAAPLKVCGVPGPKGERPVIDGENATTAKTSTFRHPHHERRGLIVVSGMRREDDTEKKPQHVVIEGLELRNAYEKYGFTDAKGEKKEYTDNAACIFVERGENITVRNNEIHGCGNGFFVASGGEQDNVSRNILVDGNHLHGNGTTGSRGDRHHNAYTEALGIVYQFNRFGPAREGSHGIQLKDRSAGNVVRYNWFEGGERVLDLVEAEESAELAKKDPRFNKTHVYGNVMVLGERASSRVIHYGGDNGDTDDYRKGTLYFYDNTMVIHTQAKDQYNLALIALESNAETADVRNNIIYSSSDASLFWLFEAGTLKLGANWVSRGIQPARHKLTGKIEHVLGSDKTILGTTPPGFVNVQEGNYCLQKSSPARGVAGPLAAVGNELLPTLQYKKHLGQAPRPSPGSGGDLGALVCD